MAQTIISAQNLVAGSPQEPARTRIMAVSEKLEAIHEGMLHARWRARHIGDRLLGEPEAQPDEAGEGAIQGEVGHLADLASALVTEVDRLHREITRLEEL